MRIKRESTGELNFFQLNQQLEDNQKVDLLYYTLTNLYPFDSEDMDVEKYIEFVQSEVRALLTTELT
jgi:histidinol phosphatase-like PHP family hydrolase|tara:strand:+ start:68 stop:268 length:201 start_codon:yes stop_codon:yes gene_type:complete